MLIRLFVLALCLAVGLPAGVRGEEEASTPCSTPEAREFDFWIGEWDLTWEGGTGTNVITSTLGGCVIEENFDGRAPDGTGLAGNSLSVYSPARGKWLQTWVDNSGGYLDFVGSFKDGKMILGREANRDGKTFLQRMVFYNIQRDELDWSWERSDDEGETWKPLWVIHYTRKD